MKHGPYAKTDVENAKALTDLTTAEVTRRRRTAITAAVEHTPPAPVTSTDRTVRWTAKWKCPACRAWTNDPISKSCLSCATQQRSN